MSPKFIAGDVVTLKSGGPRMTVCGYVSVASGEKVECVWFNQHIVVATGGPEWLDPQGGQFSEVALKAANA